jgi:hypothetical protein
MEGQTERSNRRVQFSLRSLFVLMAVVALLCGLLVAGSPAVRWCTGLALLLLLPLVWTVMLIYGRGYQRTFAIGAMFPGGIVLVYVSITFYYVALGMLYNVPATTWHDLRDFVGQSATTLAGIAGVELVLSILFGIVATGLRWMIEPRR